MAISVDATSASLAQANVSSFSWNHTVGSGSNATLVVCVSSYDAASAYTVQGITYNGVALSSVVATTHNGQIASSIWKLDNPATGTNSIAVTLTGNTDEVAGGAISLFGCSGAVGGTQTGGGTGIPSIAVTTSPIDSYVIDCAFTASAPTAGAGQTQIHNVDISGDYTCSSYEVSNSTSTTMSWSAGGLYAIVAAEFLPTTNPIVMVLV